MSKCLETQQIDITFASINLIINDYLLMMPALPKKLSYYLIAAAMLFPAAANALKPAVPTATYSWGLEDGTGVVNCSVKAPTSYFNFFYEGDPFEAGTTLTMTVVRSCKAISNDSVEVFSVKGVSPGQTINRADNAIPAWQYGFEYTYTAYVEIEGPDGEKSPESSTPLKPGYNYSKFYIDDAKASADMKTVTIKSTVPTEYLDTSGNAVKLPENYFTAFKLYCQETPPTPNDTPTETYPDPVQGQEYTFTTEKFTLNKDNTWYVVAEGPYGNAISVRRRMYVGYETPGAIQITGAQKERHVELSWTAPTAGISGGQMGPYAVTYNVYRTWGYGEDNRKLLAENIEAQSYTDKGEDLEEAKLVNYQVVPYTEVGEGNDLCFANSTNYADKPFGIGPDVALPFSDKFVGAGYGNDTQQKWSFSASKPTWTIGRPAKTGDGYYDPTVQPIFKGENIAYTLFTGASSQGKEATMTSWYIDIKSASKPELSLYYYAISDNDAALTVEASDGKGDFVPVKKISISEGTNASTYDIEDIETNWKHETIDLSEYKAWPGFRLRFKASYTSKPASVMLSHISLDNNTSGIDAIAGGADTPLDIYSITGICVAKGVAPSDVPALAPGIYIFRSASSARKVVVK